VGTDWESLRGAGGFSREEGGIKGKDECQVEFLLFSLRPSLRPFYGEKSVGGRLGRSWGGKGG